MSGDTGSGMRVFGRVNGAKRISGVNCATARLRREEMPAVRTRSRGTVTLQHAPACNRGLRPSYRPEMRDPEMQAHPAGNAYLIFQRGWHVPEARVQANSYDRRLPAARQNTGAQGRGVGAPASYTFPLKTVSAESHRFRALEGVQLRVRKHNRRLRVSSKAPGSSELPQPQNGKEGDMKRQVVMSSVALALVPLLGTLRSPGAARGSAGDESAARGKPARTFNSKLPFRVWAWVEGKGPRRVGETPAEEPLAIPECEWWAVEPLAGADMQKVREEVKLRRIPGLRLPCSASDADLAGFEELTGLQTLDLRRTQVTDAGLVHLKELKGLETLELWGTKVRGPGLVHVKELKGLKTLGLLGTQVTDAGLVHLKELKGLRELDLWNTEVTDAGAERLRKSLPNTTILY